jgi:hypothetical protein
MAKKPQKKVKRMNINVEATVHDQFKAATAAKGVKMTEVLLKYIKDYVDKNLPSELKQKKGRG